MKEAPRKGIESDDIIDFILIAFPVAIIGARLYYVIFQWSYYREHPGEILPYGTVGSLSMVDSWQGL